MQRSLVFYCSLRYTASGEAAGGSLLRWRDLFPLSGFFRALGQKERADVVIARFAATSAQLNGHYRNHLRRFVAHRSTSGVWLVDHRFDFVGSGGDLGVWEDHKGSSQPWPRPPFGFLSYPNPYQLFHLIDAKTPLIFASIFVVARRNYDWNLSFYLPRSSSSRRRTGLFWPLLH